LKKEKHCAYKIEIAFFYKFHCLIQSLSAKLKNIVKGITYFLFYKIIDVKIALLL